MSLQITLCKAQKLGDLGECPLRKNLKIRFSEIEFCVNFDHINLLTGCPTLQLSLLVGVSSVSILLLSTNYNFLYFAAFFIIVILLNLRPLHRNAIQNYFSLEKWHSLLLVASSTSDLSTSFFSTQSRSAYV